MEKTPGFGGYAAAWAVSVMLFSVLLVGSLGTESGYAGAPTAVVVVAVYASVVPVPFALVGIPVVHLACRRVEAQWVHVLTAGAVGLLPFIVFGWSTDGATGDSAELLSWLSVPIATAIGRWSVVPLVRRRRRVAHPAPVMG